jgi:oligosaccharide repeat unit polymerase
MNYTLVNTVGLMVVTALLVWLWQKTHDILSFANVFSVSFGVPVLGSQIWYGLIESPYVPTPDTVALLYAGWISLLLGAAIVVRRQPKTLHVARITLIDPYIAKPVLVFLMLAHFAFTIRLIYSTGLSGIFNASQFSLVDSIAENRLDSTAATGGQSAVSVGWYLEIWHNAFVYYVPLALYLYRQGKLSKKVLPLILAAAGLMSLVLFTRVQFAMLVVFGLVTWVVLFQPAWRKVALNAVIMACVAVGLFASMQSVLVRLSYTNNTALSDQLATYAFSSAPSFQEMLNGNYFQSNPHDALFVGESFYYLLGKFGLLDPKEYPIGVREYVFVPEPTNVYTFLDGFALDFGVAGIILGPLFMGMGMGWVYNRLRARITYLWLLLYCLCVYTCSIANLQNFLVTFFAVVFVGVTLLLQPLVSARRQLAAPVPRPRELMSRA